VYATIYHLPFVSLTRNGRVNDSALFILIHLYLSLWTPEELYF